MDVFELNKIYESNDNNGLLVNNQSYKVINGDYPILFSAPHAVRQYRDGSIKAADMLTGGIVEYLAKEMHVHGIMRTCNMYDDPNYDMSGYGMIYKKNILDYVNQYNIWRFLDIHGSSDNNDFDISIGTNNGINIMGADKELRMLTSVLSSLGKVVVDEKFKASKEYNICRFVASYAHIPAFQLEISKRIRLYETLKLLDCFKIIITEIMKDYHSGEKDKTLKKSLSFGN